MTEKLEMKIGDKIKELLKGCEKNQSWLSKIIYLDKSEVSRIVNHKREPTPEHIERIAAAFNMTIPEFLAGTELDKLIPESKENAKNTQDPSWLKTVLQELISLRNENQRLENLTVNQIEAITSLERDKLQLEREIEKKDADGKRHQQTTHRLEREILALQAQNRKWQGAHQQLQHQSRNLQSYINEREAYIRQLEQHAESLRNSNQELYIQYENIKNESSDGVGTFVAGSVAGAILAGILGSS